VQFNATAIRIEPCKEPAFNKSFFLWSLCYDYYPDRESKEYIWDYCRGTVVKLGYTKEGNFVLSCFDKKRIISSRFNDDVIKFIKGDYSKMSYLTKDIISEFCNKTYDENKELPYDEWIESNYYNSEWYHNIQPALYPGKLHTDIQARLYGLEDCEEFPANEEVWSKPNLDKEDYFYEIEKVPNMYNPFVELKTILHEVV